MKNYLLSHGFGFSNDFWQNLIKLIHGKIYFYGDKSLDKSKKYIGIGHSLGFLKLNNSNLNFESIVSLQGFLNFCGKDNTLRKIRLQNIEKFKKELVENTVLNLKKFRLNCGYDKEIKQKFHLQQMIHELEMMKNSYKHCGIKTLVICSENDNIVPLRIIYDNFQDIANCSILKIQGTGHSLGYNKSKFLWEKINEFNS